MINIERPHRTLALLKVIDEELHQPDRQLSDYDPSHIIEVYVIYDHNQTPRHFDKKIDSFFLDEWLEADGIVVLDIQEIKVIDEDFVYDRYVDDIEEKLAWNMKFLRAAEGALSSKSKKRDSKSTCYLYLIHKEGTNHVKIGISSSPKRRLREVQNQVPANLAIIKTYKMERGQAKTLEHTLHKTLSDFNVINEWFDLSEERLQALIADLDNQLGTNSRKRKLL